MDLSLTSLAMEPFSSTRVIMKPPVVNSHLMVTRGKDGIFRTKTWIASSSGGDSAEPTKVFEAFASTQWKVAMDDKYMALIRTNTWTLVAYSPTYNVVSCKWVFKLKKNVDGSI